MAKLLVILAIAATVFCSSSSASSVSALSGRSDYGEYAKCEASGVCVGVNEWADAVYMRSIRALNRVSGRSSIVKVLGLFRFCGLPTERLEEKLVMIALRANTEASFGDYLGNKSNIDGRVVFNSVRLGLMSEVGGVTLGLSIGVTGKHKITYCRVIKSHQKELLRMVDEGARQ